MPDYPRLPELYLEAGAALLMACRPADCMALCNEVINTTLELLPQRLVLEDPEKRSHGEDNDDNGEDKAAVLFWTGTAYLLQGHCYSQLKDWKQAVTHYTRSVFPFCANKVKLTQHVTVTVLQVYQTAG